MVHTSISNPCSGGTGPPTTKYATHSNRIEDEGGWWVTSPEGALEKLLGGKRQEAEGHGQGPGGVVLAALGASNKSDQSALLME